MYWGATPCFINPRDDSYYELLGVSRHANDEELKRAYKNQARKWHPDRHMKERGTSETDEDTAKARFQNVMEAFLILTDDKKRDVYDKFGHRGLQDYIQEQQDIQNGAHPSMHEAFRESYHLKDFANTPPTHLGSSMPPPMPPPMPSMAMGGIGRMGPAGMGYFGMGLQEGICGFGGMHPHEKGFNATIHHDAAMLYNGDVNMCAGLFHPGHPTKPSPLSPTEEKHQKRPAAVSARPRMLRAPRNSVLAPNDQRRAEDTLREIGKRAWKAGAASERKSNEASTVPTLSSAMRFVQTRRSQPRKCRNNTQDNDASETPPPPTGCSSHSRERHDRPPVHNSSQEKNCGVPRSELQWSWQRTQQKAAPKIKRFEGSAFSRNKS